MRRFFRNLARLPLLARYVWRLYRDPRVPTWGKVLFVVLAASYGLWPVDLVPEAIPLAGVLDDAIVVPALLWLITQVTPKFVRQENRAKVGLDPAGGRGEAGKP